MPAPFPSHAAAVLPLKLWRPHWFDGVALVVGSAVPDLPYAAGCCGPPYTLLHTWWGSLVAVAFTLVLARLVRWALPAVVAHLPDTRLALRDYAVLARVRPSVVVSAYSAWLGGASHIVWDHVTHPSMAGTGLGIAALEHEMAFGVPGWVALHGASTVLGAIVWLAVSVHIGRDRLLLRWHGAAPTRSPRPRRFWTWAAVFTGLALGLLFAPGSEPTTVVMRVVLAPCVGLLFAAALT